MPGSYEEKPWIQAEGTTVFAPVEEGSTMPGSPEHQWAINFRVDDLQAMVEQ